jgi:hypothetical protein
VHSHVPTIIDFAVVFLRKCANAFWQFALVRKASNRIGNEAALEKVSAPLSFCALNIATGGKQFSNN